MLKRLHNSLPSADLFLVIREICVLIEVSKYVLFLTPSPITHIWPGYVAAFQFSHKGLIVEFPGRTCSFKDLFDLLRILVEQLETLVAW